MAGWCVVIWASPSQVIGTPGENSISGLHLSTNIDSFNFIGLGLGLPFTLILERTESVTRNWAANLHQHLGPISWGEQNLLHTIGLPIYTNSWREQNTYIWAHFQGRTNLLRTIGLPICTRTKSVTYSWAPEIYQHHEEPNLSHTGLNGKPRQNLWNKEATRGKNIYHLSMSFIGAASYRVAQLHSRSFWQKLLLQHVPFPVIRPKASASASVEPPQQAHASMAH